MLTAIGSQYLREAVLWGYVPCPRVSLSMWFPALGKHMMRVLLIPKSQPQAKTPGRRSREKPLRTIILSVVVL